jgi:hypothetical protein
MAYPFLDPEQPVVLTGKASSTEDDCACEDALVLTSEEEDLAENDCACDETWPEV